MCPEALTHSLRQLSQCVSQSVCLSTGEEGIGSICSCHPGGLWSGAQLIAHPLSQSVTLEVILAARAKSEVAATLDTPPPASLSPSD